MQSQGPADMSTWPEAYLEMRPSTWPGPRPLRPEDASFLVGRDQELQHFLSDVERYRLIVLTGESGVGKSSLLAAGFKPHLKQNSKRVVLCDNWSQASDAVRSAPQETGGLTRAGHAAGGYLASLISPQLEEDAPDPGVGFLDQFTELDEKLGSRLVLILDQFEELIRDSPDFTEGLFEFLTLLNRHTNIRIVISLRSEHIHQLRALERRVNPHSFVIHFLEEVSADQATAIVGLPGDEVIDQRAVEVIARAWQDTKAAESSHSVGRVGLLHLQALLFLLDVATTVERPIREDAVTRLMGQLRPSGDPSDRAMFVSALERSVDARLDLCEEACREALGSAAGTGVAARAPGVSASVILGTESALVQIVRHLSSDGFKLVWSVEDLAAAAIGDRLRTLSLGMDAEDDVEIRESLLAELGLDADGALGGDGGGGDSEGNRRRQRLLSTSTYELLRETGVAADSVGPGPAAPVGSQDDRGVTAGVLLGRSPVESLTEEYRRFFLAMAWLEQTSLARVTRVGSQRHKVALVHDGYGRALEGWSEGRRRDNQTGLALAAVTRPKGAEFEWVVAGPSIEDVPGGAGAPDAAARSDRRRRDGFGLPLRRDDEWEPLFVPNLRWRGAWVLGGVFDHVVFLNCDLRGTGFDRCVFRGASFVNCLLDGAMFTDCTVIGAAGAPAQWSLDPPRYAMRGDTAAVAGELARYQQPDAEIAAPARLLADRAGLAARSVVADEQRIVAEDRIGQVDEPEPILPFDPPRQGVVIAGGRISSLTVRRLSFLGQDLEVGGGRLSLWNTAGSGFDVVEHEQPGGFEIHGSALRHVTFTSSPIENSRSDVDHITVTIRGSAIHQMWIGDDLRGTIDADDYTLLAGLWNGSEHVAVRLGQRECSAIDLVSRGRVDGGPDLSVHSPVRGATEERVLTRHTEFEPEAWAAFMNVARKTDYRRDPERSSSRDQDDSADRDSTGPVPEEGT